MFLVQASGFGVSVLGFKVRGSDQGLGIGFLGTFKVLGLANQRARFQFKCRHALRVGAPCGQPEHEPQTINPNRANP